MEQKLKNMYNTKALYKIKNFFTYILLCDIIYTANYTKK